MKIFPKRKSMCKCNIFCQMFFQIFPYFDHEIINTLLTSYDIEILYYHFNYSRRVPMSTQF